MKKEEERLVSEEQMEELLGLFREVVRQAAEDLAEGTDDGALRSVDLAKDWTDERDGGAD